MDEYLKNNPIALRACVMYEFVRRHQARKYHSNLSFSAYQKFCKVIGENVMEYREFDFWFHRFLNGEFDLSFERDKKKKIHGLTDMPIVVMEKIAENLNFFDRLELEKTSRSLRTFINNQKLILLSVQFNVQKNLTRIRLNENDNREIFYHCSPGRRRKADRQQCTKDYWDDATEGLKKILKHPRLYLDSLEAYFAWDNGKFISISKIFWKQLDTPTYQLHLKKLDLKVIQIKTLLKLLPYFTPGYLETIEIDTYRPNENNGLKELVELEQWKQAKYFSTKGTLFVGPLRYLYHFKEFSVRLEKISVEGIREMKEILFNSPVFEKCSLTLKDPVDFGQEFGDAIPGTTNIYHYPIPNTNEYFEIKVEEEEEEDEDEDEEEEEQKIEISRKKK